MTTLALLLPLLVAGQATQPATRPDDEPRPSDRTVQAEKATLTPLIDTDLDYYGVEQRGVGLVHPTVLLGLRFDLEPGWHLYWRNPGGAGLPPRIELELPEGWSAGELMFPAPIRFESGGIESFGYTGDVTFLVPIKVREGGDVSIRGTVRYLICDDQTCLPGEAAFEISATADQRVRLFKELTRVPISDGPGSWRAVAPGVVEARDPRGRPIPDDLRVTFFPLPPEGVEASAVVADNDGERLRVEADYRVMAGAAAPEALPGVVVFGDGRDPHTQPQAIVIPLTDAPADAAGAGVPTSRPD